MNGDSDGRDNVTAESLGSRKSDRYYTEDSQLFSSFSMNDNVVCSGVDEVTHTMRRNSSASETLSQAESMFASNQASFQKCQHHGPEALPDSANSQPLIPTSSGMGKRNDILIGIVVSRWDNIVGPQCSYLWTEELTSLFYPGNLPKHFSRLIKYVTDHTVDHHEVEGNLVSHSTMKSGLCIVPDLNLVYMSLSIRVPSDSPCEIERSGSTVPHSVAVLANLQYLRHFVLMRPLISIWLMEFAPKIGVLICKNKLQMSMINSWCAELCKTMAAVRTCWWQKVLTDKNELNNGESFKGIPVVKNDGASAVSNGPATVNTHWDYMPPPTDRKSLEMIITSHLTTGCSAVVVGSDTDAMNHVIRFLLCFSKSDEGYCSRYVLPTLPDTFMKGLFVQGLIAGEIGEKSISGNHLSSNRHPFTHIDLNTKYTKVRQMPVQTHQSQREMTLIQELTALWNSTTYVSPLTDLFSQPVTESGGFVNKLVSDLHLLPPDKRYGRLLLFRRLVHAKALGLIVYLQSIQYKPQKEKALLVRHLRETLGLDEIEFLIVQMTADKIRPGVLNVIRQ